MPCLVPGTFPLTILEGRRVELACTCLQKGEPPFPRSESGVSGECPLVRSTVDGEPEAKI